MAEQWCQKAKDKYALSKSAATRDGCKGMLEEAAQSWQHALGLLGSHLVEQRKVVHKNLAMAHMRLAFVAVEDTAEDLLSYHVKQMSSHMTQSGFDNDAWTSLTRKFIDGVVEFSPSQHWQLILLQTYADTMPPSQLLLEKAIATAHIHRAVRAVPEADYTPALLSMRSELARGAKPSFIGKSSETADWILVQGYVQKGCISFARAAGMIDEEDKELVDLMEQARFINHRASVILRLGQALQAQEIVMKQEGFDMRSCFEVLDMLVDALHVAQRDINVPQVLGESKMDVEMVCVCLHYLAKFYEILKLSRQAQIKHRECVTWAMSLDGTNINDLDQLVEGRSTVKGLLSTKCWFRESMIFLQKQQRKAAQAYSAEEERKKEKIAQPIREIQAANIGCWDLLSYLCTNFPLSESQHLPTKPENGQQVPKSQFMRFVRDYHPDKQQADKTKERLGLESWKLLSQEITKMLNHYYETLYKD
mmetsp:Transcript_42441/g.79683  ORF Transcript_42441/g.79683 Transcript_42441/m.79683 type:complete len:478 (-) Transcript_42441:128-1561(-)